MTMEIVESNQGKMNEMNGNCVSSFCLLATTTYYHHRVLPQTTTTVGLIVKVVNSYGTVGGHKSS